MLLTQIWDVVSSINYERPLMTLELWLLLTSEEESPYLSQWTLVDIHDEFPRFDITNLFAFAVSLFHFHIPFGAQGSLIHSTLALVSQKRTLYHATLFFRLPIVHWRPEPKEARIAQYHYLCIYSEAFKSRPLDSWHHLIIGLFLTPCPLLACANQLSLTHADLWIH